MEFETRSEYACWEGRQGFYSHQSLATGTRMNFAVFQPPQASERLVPVVYFLAGLTCTDETFMIKAGAQRTAAELGLMLVACDTSPRGLNLPGESDHWDFGVGAGFYLDATQPPWNTHYRMGQYINEELPALIETQFGALPGERGILGHSMGGHGALVAALRHPERWAAVSAIAPIAHPSAVPWGQKAFSRYLGEDRTQWSEWDAVELMRRRLYPGEILVDQGLNDVFLGEQLRADLLEAAAQATGQSLRLRRHALYDHSYWFIQTVIHEHLEHHAARLTS